MLPVVSVSSLSLCKQHTHMECCLVLELNSEAETLADKPVMRHTVRNCLLIFPKPRLFRGVEGRQGEPQTTFCGNIKGIKYYSNKIYKLSAQRCRQAVQAAGFELKPGSLQILVSDFRAGTDSLLSPRGQANPDLNTWPHNPSAVLRDKSSLGFAGCHASWTTYTALHCSLQETSMPLCCLIFRLEADHRFISSALIT